MAIFYDLLNEDCSDISDWTSGGSGTSYVNPAGYFFFHASESSDQAIRYRSISSPPGQHTIEINIDFVTMDTGPGYESSFYLFYSTGTWRFKVLFSPLGLFIYKAGGASAEVGVNIVKCNGSHAYQIWRFEIDKLAGEANAIVKVYLDNVYQGTFDCDYEVAGTDGQIYLLAQGTAGESTTEFYIDYINIGTGIWGFTSNINLLNEGAFMKNIERQRLNCLNEINKPSAGAGTKDVKREETIQPQMQIIELESLVKKEDLLKLFTIYGQFTLEIKNKQLLLQRIEQQINLIQTKE